jgi:predicted dehydrogenase
MEKLINIGIIGAGGVGERFLQALQRHPRAKVVGIYDTNNERLDYISNKYKVPSVNQYQELLDNKDIELVYLAVPPKYHHDIAIDIIKANKHIICEKPLANSIEEAKEMMETAEKHNIVHAMNFPTVYSPAFKKLSSLLEDGFIGKLQRVELHTYFEQWPRAWQQNNWISSREQGGFVREVFSHYIQITQRLFGDITDINTSIIYPEDQLLCETSIIATASLADNVPVLLNGFHHIGMEEKLSYTLYGTEGTISLVNWRELWVSSRGEKQVMVELPANDSLVELIEDVFNAMEGKDSNRVTFEGGYDVQVAIEKLLDRE